tara:strand:- start:4785 stop:4934 length:150 start_codon:yes stop_codon:yes gene_type:complete
MIGPVDNQFLEIAQEGGRRRGRPRKTKGTKKRRTRRSKPTKKRRRSRKH